MKPRIRRELPPEVADLIDALGVGPATASAVSIEHAATAAAMVAARMSAPLLLVLPTSAQAERVGTLVRWLLANGPVPYGFLRWPRGAESPYEEVVESPFVASARAGTLGTFALSDGPFALALDAPSLARRTLPFDAFMEGVQLLEVGREVDRDALTGLLAAAGYRRTTTVAEVGEFAVRGGVVDLFSPFDDDPVRVDLDGDTIAALKFFDAATQRTQRTTRATWVVPAWEVPADPDRLRDARIRLADAAAELRVPSREVAAVEAQIDAGRMPPAFGAMLPLLHGDLDLPTAYLAEDALVVVVDPAGCAASASAALDALREDHRVRLARPALAASPEALAVDGEGLLAALDSRPRTLRIDLGTPGLLGPTAAFARGTDLVRATTPDVPVAQRVQGLVDVARGLGDQGGRLVIVAPSDPEARRVQDVLEAEGLEPGVAGSNGLNELLDAGDPVRVGVGRLRATIGIDPLGVLVVPSESVFGLKDHVAGRRGERRGVMPLAEFRELAPGDLVIHRHHGIGSFEGLKEFTVDGRTTECLELSYKGGDRLYVPVERSDLLERYVSPGEGARELDRLGGQAWVKRKRSARKAAQEIAGRLRLIYARRLAATAEPMSPPDAEFREFEATFPFETTPDQERAIEEVLQDVTRDRPMDRLVCGDVGFGKTEVAVRAAYKAAMDGHQVAVLVPTTILAEQHRLTFAARLRNTPIRVESLSRFKTPAEVRKVLAGLKSGGVDIVIGTHRLLSKDVVFRDLGLLVIDEEHRFGVAHKERLREMAASVHTLTLTATPIPRTLHMALSGIRDLSVIATPPRDRLAVKTFVARSSRDLVRSALLRELGRGGQVFIVHNRVEDIYEFANGIATLVPEARVTVAHGQMSAPDLEGVMSAFVRGDKDVLVCTTIIESGLDVGTANTMLISGADSLGLAQLYQLRGRVGRAAEQAYCYLLVRDPATLTDDARKRIEAIERFSELASGFHLASMDLEIRGAGDVLGADQSGHMAAVGYDLFLEMVSEAVAELSGEAQPDRVDPELKLDVEARIPAEAIPDERLRLRFYKRLAAARDLPEVVAVASDMADRFGRLPAPIERLVAFMRIKVHARALGLAQVGLTGGVLQVAGAAGHPSAVPAVLAAATASSWRIVPGGDAGRARVQMPRATAPDARLTALEDLLAVAVGLAQTASEFAN